jgi:RimK family alpha-L-glutamate ligase
MRILIVGLVKNDQLQRIRVEGEKRGHTVDGCYKSELVLFADNDRFEPSLRGKDLGSYDLIYLWATGKNRWEWYTAAYYLKKKFNTVIVNQKTVDPKKNYYLTPAIDYLTQIENKLPLPKSAIIASSRSVECVLEKFKFPLIMKISTGHQGRGVFKLENENALKAKVKELEDSNQSLIIREFIPNDGDIRVFCVGYKAIGAMKRTPPRGDFRSNISVGGLGAEYDLDSNPNVRDIAERFSSVMEIEIAGVDIMIHKETGQPYILEINPGPQFLGLEKYTSVNAALEIIKYFEAIHKQVISGT